MPYDISEAFEKIEDELIGSMIRNLDRHKAEETERGYRWEQWQAVQLKALEDYHRNNREKFPERFNKLNQQIREVLQDSYNDGSTKQERKLLQAVKRGFKGESGTNAPAFTGQTETTGEFFKVNDRKLDALITAATHDMERAETAVLRKADDQYRRIIFNAQVYANTGAGTYEKAVDMATKDFLRAGINCIEYKNGSRHTITDYADMAIRTAAKRAYLQGEGAKRQEQGIPTVILNKRSNACPLCTPFCGKVFIDDVWSGGDKSGISPVTGAKYPLLSDAIAQGLYHPRCQDSHTTYFEGINTAPDDSEYTKEELDAMAEKYNAEQKQAYCERQEKRYSRMSEYSLAPDNKRMYKARAEEWGQRVENFKNLTVSNVENVAEESKPSINDSVAVVDIKITNSSEYRKMYDRLGENTKITRSIFQQAKAILKHRSGGDFEDLSFIDSITGKFLTRTDYNVEKQCIPSKAMCRMVTNAEPFTIIGIHNHPNSSVPSLDDINQIWKRKQKYGIIACHNGNIYKYRVIDEFNRNLVDMILDRVNKIIYNKEELGIKFEKELSKALIELRHNNVEMEVFLWK